MIYVMSDLHGCYDKYIKMLEKIKFKKEDTLYILGDAIDRGDDGIKILLDMMRKPNVIPMLGNHESMAYEVLRKFNVEVTEYNFDTQIDAAAMGMFEEWVYNGGLTTCREFTKLGRSRREDILDYFEEMLLYEEIEVAGKSFVLVHGGLLGFDENKDLSEYTVYDIIWDRCDYEKVYYPDKYLITGHTPTVKIDEKYEGRIYKKNNHIAIDCGAVFLGTLGCICLDTMEEFYVE